MKKPKIVLIKASRAYWISNIFATLVYIIPALLLAWVCCFAFVKGLPVILDYRFIGALRAGMAILMGFAVTLAVLFLLFAGYQVQIFVKTFWMTEAERERRYQMHNEWDYACDLAEAAGEPLPKRPY